MTTPLTFPLRNQEVPNAWYNLLADFPEPLPPPLHPGTRQPVTPDLMTALFPESLVAQEMSPERWIEIPEEVRQVYALYRPTPLMRAVRLEKALNTPAHIYYKYEGVSPAGSHKPNTAVPQAFFNSIAGVKRLTTETGAGQWGTSLSFAGQIFGLEVLVFQVRVSYDQKPYRRAVMETYGARCLPSPSTETAYGRSVLAVGQNSRAAWLAGLDVGRTRFLTYVLSAFLAGVCGVLLSGFSRGAALNMGEEFLLASIATVVSR